MLRGWILNVVSAGSLVCAASLAPMASAQTLIQRLGLGSQGSQPATRVISDPNVRPAAAAADNRPRAAREQAMSGTSRRTSSTNGGGGGGGTFFSRIHLPGFGSSSQPAAGDEPPAAYGPSTGRPQGTATGAAQRRPATTTTGQQGTGAPRTATARPATPPQTQTVPAATPRVARSSPRVDNRHNELADALTGLRDAPEETAVDTTDVSISPPAATDGEAAPSYLDDEATTGRGAATAAPSTEGGSDSRGWSRGPVDVGAALLGPDSPAPRAAAPAVRTAAPVTAATAAPRRTATSTTATPPVRRQAVQAAAPVRRSPARTPVIERDAAAALQAAPVADSGPLAGEQTEQQDGDSLGTIAAEPASPSYLTESTATPVTKPVARSGNQSTPPSAVVPVPRTIGNLRPAKRDVLLSCQPPVIVSNVTGPQKIVVGATAEYRVVLENKGEGPARELTASITVPGSADVVDAAASNGAIDRVEPSSEGQPRTIKWQLYELAAGSSQSLTLKLTPRGGEPMQLAVQCSQAPTTVEAMVEVQEPKLNMEITGPSEVLFGKSQRYSLTLANPGTGSAEDVLIELTPPGGDPKAPVRHKVGTLEAGASKTIELELTAREAGDLKMLASASAAGQLRIETTKTVVCRRAELDVDYRGPEQNFAGAVATYFLRVRNPGTAAADKVGVQLTLPAGAEFVDASTGHTWDATRRTVVWQPGSLAASEERFMQVRCRLTNAGVNHMELVARTATGDLSDVADVPVTVEALADLKLQVSDPEGVLPVGETALYEIHVQNRGQTAARGVNVIAMFSEGIEPSHVEGGQHEIRDGRVSFRPIDTLPAGAEVVLRIHAKATQPGTHVFRTEVVCDDLDTKLVAEETTRYFVEEQRWADASAAYSEGGEAATR